MTYNRDDPDRRRQTHGNRGQTAPPGREARSRRERQPPQGGQQPPQGGQQPTQHGVQYQGTGAQPPQGAGGTGWYGGEQPPFGGQPAPGGVPTQGWAQPPQGGGHGTSGGQRMQAQGTQPAGSQPPQQWHQPPGMASGTQPAGTGRGVDPSTAAGAGRQMGRPARPRLRPTTVEDVLQRDVITADRDTPIATVVAMMAQENVGSVVVVDQDSPVGVLTDRSIALALQSTPDVAEKRAEELITRDVVVGTPDMSVFEVLERLGEEEIRRLPIVGEDGSLLGIVTLDDVLYLLGSELDHVTEIIQAQSHHL